MRKQVNTVASLGVLGRNRDFAVLSGVQALSKLGTQATDIAVPLLVIAATGSPALAGLVGTIEGLATLVVLVPIGVVVDRVSRRSVMLVSDSLCIAGSLGMVAVVLTGFWSAWIVIVATALLAGCGAAFSVTSSAASRQILPDADLAEAMAVSQARNSAVYLGGPPAGAALFSVAPVLPFLLDAASYVASLTGVLSLRTRLGRVERPAGRQNWRAELRDGFAFLCGDLRLRYALVCAAVMNCVFAGVLFVAIVDRGMGGHNVSAGLLVSCVGLGSLLGSLVAPRVIARFAGRTIIVTILWAWSGLIMAMAVVPTTLWMGALLCVSSLLVPAVTVVVMTTQMALTPDGYQGRVNAAMSFVALAVSPLAPGFAGLVLEHVDTRGVLLIFAAAAVTLAAVSQRNHALHRLPDMRPAISDDPPEQKAAPHLA